MIVPSAQAGAISRDKVTQARALLEDFAPYYREPRTKTGQRKLKNASSRILVVPFNPRPGDRLAISNSNGPRSAVVVDSVRHEDLGDVTFEDARAEGYATTGAFIDAWVRQHDKAWVIRYADETPAWARTELESAHPDVDPRIVTRFTRRWARRRVAIITFTRNPEESARLLGRPGADYVSNPARALSETDHLVGEAVNLDEQKQITDDAWTTTSQWQAIERARQDRDRELLSLEERVVRAHRAASRQNIDVSNEIYLLRKRLDRGSGPEAVVKRLQVLENRVYRAAA